MCERGSHSERECEKEIERVYMRDREKRCLVDDAGAGIRRDVGVRQHAEGSLALQLLEILEQRLVLEPDL